MFAFVCAVSDPERYRRHAEVGIARVREPDSVVLAVSGGAEPALRINDALDGLASLPDLEGVVVVHDDVVLESLDTLAVLRGIFRDPWVALAGAIGATDVQSLAWWDGVARGRIGTPHAAGGGVGTTGTVGDVEALDGTVLCFSPWAVRTLRFDRAQAGDFHGYDVDLCLQARHRGRRVVVAPIRAHHEHRARMTDPERWARGEVRFQTRWNLRRELSQRLHDELTTSDHRGPAADG